MSTMSNSEKLIIGVSILILVVLIVGAIVMIVKKNDGNVCSGDSQYNCGVYKNKKDCNEAGPSDVPGGCKWGPPSPKPSPKPSPNNNNNGICCDNGSGYPNCSLDTSGNTVKKEECLKLEDKCDWKPGSTACPDSKLKGSCNPTPGSQKNCNLMTTKEQCTNIDGCNWVQQPVSRQ